MWCINKRQFFLASLLLSILAPVLWAQTAYETGFDRFKTGEFKTLNDGQAIWRTISGRAEISDRYHGSNPNTLHIFGGNDSTVELELSHPITGLLTFRAERWTARTPFSFHVDAWLDNQWQTIYTGDNIIRVGARLLSSVRVDLPRAVSRFRFVCTAPDTAGILIDELSIVPPIKMKLLSITQTRQVRPVLIGKPANPILQINIRVEGNIEPIRLVGLKLNARSTTDLADIDLLQVVYTANRPECSTDTRFGYNVPPASDMVARGSQVLQHGDNYFWITCRLKPTADLSHYIRLECEEALFSNRKVLRPTAAGPASRLKIGTVVRAAGQDGVNTYRIPGLTTTNQGTLIAVYDIRHRSSADLPGDIDIGMSRSTDGGQNWSPMQTIMDMGSAPQFNYDGIGDPAVLVDRTNNTIWVAAVWSHGPLGWNGSGPGMSPDQTGQLMMVKSVDDGLSWSDPVNITSQVKNPQWSFLLQGPGRGITLRDGTLVFAAQYIDSPANHRLPYSTIIFSRDHGQTWQCGRGAKSNTTEAQLVQLDDGRLMLNMRDNRNRGDFSASNGRSVYTSADLGQTWTEHATSRSALPEPVCMASLIRFSSRLDNDPLSILLFSNPAAKDGRHHMTIKASLDEGASWPSDCQLLLNVDPGFGYSCLTKIDDQHVGILYEGVRELYFQQVDINEIINKRYINW